MSNRNNKATVWKMGALDIYGSPSWATPTVIDVRWEEGERRFISSNGTEARGRHTIYFEGDDVIDIGDYIYRGVSVATSPVTGSWEIKQTYRVENLSGTKTEWSAVA